MTERRSVAILSLVILIIAAVSLGPLFGSAPPADPDATLDEDAVLSEQDGSRMQDPTGS